MESYAETNIAMVAGEASGDLLAARLLSGLRPELPNAYIHGIGGERMAGYGFESHWPLEKLTVRGLFEIIPRYRELKGIQNQLYAQLCARRPSVFIGVDYPGFNLGLEERLRHVGIPTMHYIGPQIWAWRGGRIKKIQRAVSHMLVIFPFEEEIYRKAGVPVTYVGHPLAEMIPMEIDIHAARIELGLSPDRPVLALLPGSRMAEIKYLTAEFVRAVSLLRKRYPDLQVVVPMVGVRQRAAFTEILARSGLLDVEMTIVDGKSHQAMAAADVVLAASGTATLEVALHKKPMVIAYRVMAASWHIMRHMGYLPWIGLPNILAREFLVPEFLQNAVRAQDLADALSRQLEDQTLRENLIQRFTNMHLSLRRDSARESARAVLSVIGKRIAMPV